MASKKYILMAGIICLFASGSYAQAGASYDVKDSSLIPSKRMPQHSEFLNGTYTFPAKPRNQIEVGLKAGAFGISGDVPAVFPTLGFGAHVRKAFGYIFSMRAEYMYGTAKGLSWLAANNYGKNPAWSTKYAAPLLGYYAATNSVAFYNSKTGGLWTPSTKMETVFYNYKSTVQDLSLQGVISLNNLRFHKRLSSFLGYFFAGVGASVYKTSINSLDANGNPYDFSGISSNNYSTRKETKDAVKAKLDDSYETPADFEGGTRRPKLGGNTLKPSGTAGLGGAFKLNDKVNLSLEYRHTLTNDDLMDGQRWQDANLGVPALTRDVDSYSFISFGVNINLGSNAVQPLWWLNPMDYTYSEIRNPRLMRLPKPVLPDSDLDGVTDQFDQEQTPTDCPVDSHGVTKDTDGDGIPDCKDKELITPTYCQPVDADGIGKCPCPDGCMGVAPAPPTCAQLLGALPSVGFAKNSSKLSDDAKRLLAVVADRMRNSPGCKVVVMGYCASNKIEQQRSWDRVNNIITYLQEKEGVSGDRFIFKYGEEGGDCDVVDLRSANVGEDGTNTVPAPHPNLRKN